MPFEPTRPPPRTRQSRMTQVHVGLIILVIWFTAMIACH